MNKIISGFLAGVVVLQSMVVGVAFAAPVQLSDIAGHPYQTAIVYLHGKNVIEGYKDGSFKPNSTINRAELLKILVGASGNVQLEGTKYKNCFPDVKELWYAKYVCFAKEQGWVKGYKDGKFKPDQPITKVEAMKMLLNSQGLPVAEKVSGKSQYKDVDFKQWFGPYMFVAEAMQIVNIGAVDYSPKAFITRGEISDNIYRATLILQYKVGNFDEVLIEMSADKKLEEIVDQPNGDNGENPGNQQFVVTFDSPVLITEAKSPTSILVKWTTPIQTGDSAIETYVLEYKTGNEVNYKTSDYAKEFYDAKVKSDGGILFTSVAETMYHFRVRAININGQTSGHSNVETITTAKPLEPAAPTVEKTGQTFSTITLKVTLPKHTGDSALDSIFSSFVDPNDGFGQGGSMSIAGNNIVDSWTVKYNFSPNKDSLEQPDYEFSFWVNNKNGKVGEKVVAKFAGLSTNPDRPTVTTATIAKTSVGFNVKKPDYTGSMPIDQYYYKVDSSSGEMPLNTAGSYGKDHFENDLKGVASISGLSPNTTYVISFWVENLNGKQGDKTTKTVTTAAN